MKILAVIAVPSIIGAEGPFATTAECHTIYVVTDEPSNLAVIGKHEWSLVMSGMVDSTDGIHNVEFVVRSLAGLFCKLGANAYEEIQTTLVCSPRPASYPDYAKSILDAIEAIGIEV